MEEWSLPQELLEKIAQSKTQVPWLLFPMTKFDKFNINVYVRPNEKARYGMLSMHDQKVYHFELPDEVDNVHFLITACQSWLLIAHEDATFFLFNPFTRCKVLLPKENMCAPLVKKFVMSSNNPNTDEDCIVMAIYGCNSRLAFCRPRRDQAWTPVEDKWEGYINLIYHDGKFIAQDRNGWVAEISIGTDDSIFKEVIIRNWTKVIYGHKYLASWQGKTFMLIKNNDSKYNFCEFKYFQLDADRGQWVSLELEDEVAFFLGENQTVALAPSDVPGCKYSRCIYYSNYLKNYPTVFHEILVFDLKDRCIQHLNSAMGVLDAGVLFLADEAVWITPSLAHG